MNRGANLERGNVKYDNEKKSEAKELSAKGFTGREIAQAIGVGKSTIAVWLLPSASQEAIRWSKREHYRNPEITERIKEYARERYRLPGVKAATLARQEKKGNERRRAINAIKVASGCGNPDCEWKGQYTAAILDFHHIDRDTKSFSLSRFTTRKWVDVLDEMKKCVVVCSNCHRKIHAEKLDVSSWRGPLLE